MQDIDRGIPVCSKKRLCSLKLSHCRGCHLSSVCLPWLQSAQRSSGQVVHVVGTIAPPPGEEEFTPRKIWEIFLKALFLYITA